MTKHSPSCSYRADTGNNPVRLGQTQVKHPIYILAIISLLRMQVITWSLLVASDYSTGWNITGVIPSRGKKYSFSTMFKTILRPNQPHVQRVPGLYPAVNGREVDHSLARL